MLHASEPIDVPRALAVLGIGEPPLILSLISAWGIIKSQQEEEGENNRGGSRPAPAPGPGEPTRSVGLNLASALCA